MDQSGTEVMGIIFWSWQYGLLLQGFLHETAPPIRREEAIYSSILSLSSLPLSSQWPSKIE